MLQPFITTPVLWKKPEGPKLMGGRTKLHKKYTLGSL